MDQERNLAKGTRRCPECDAAFICNIAAGDERCWCFDFPAVMPVRADTTCLCPACLTKAIQQQQQEINQ